MGYYDVAALTQDIDFQQRVSACYATETASNPSAANPNAWTGEHIWKMAAQPGFGDAYASALAGSVANPGRDAGVISDAQILSATQAVMAAS